MEQFVGGFVFIWQTAFTFNWSTDFEMMQPNKNPDRKGQIQSNQKINWCW